MPDYCVDAATAAKQLGIIRHTVNRYCSAGRLDAIKVAAVGYGGQWRISRESIEAYLADQQPKYTAMMWCPKCRSFQGWAREQKCPECSDLRNGFVPVQILIQGTEEGVVEEIL